jgi:Domain of unknown function (DUF1877)
MSMTGRFLLLEDTEIDDLLRAPEGIHELLDKRVYEVDKAADYVDVDKAWHALHFFLTGTAWEGEPPLNFIAVGGEYIGDEDVGYGPARALRSREVMALAKALTTIAARTLVDRYDGAKMESLEIYPGGWVEYDPTRGEEFGYYSGAYEDLVALVQKGATSKRGLLIWLA